jgi:hypothetical protein
MPLRTLLVLSLLIPACDSPAPVDAPMQDTANADASGTDAPGTDAPGTDAGLDAPPLDAPSLDAGLDAPPLDAPGLDAPALDAGMLDAPPPMDAPATLDAPVPTDVSATLDAPIRTDTPATPSVVSVAAGRIVTEGTGTTTTASVLLTVTPASPVDATVRILTTPGTAGSPADYRFLSDTVSIPRGATSVTAPFEIVADGVDELDERFEVMLIDPVGVTIGTAAGMVTIADDDTADVTLDNVYVGILPITRAPEGSAAAPGSVPFVIRRQTAPIATTLTVRARTGPSGGGSPPATPGTDYVELVSTVTIPPGPETTMMLSVQFVGDGIGETNEYFNVEIISVAGAELGFPSTLAFFIDNDDPPTIGGCSTSSVLESGGDRITFRVTSALPMTAGVSVGYAYGGTASVTSDYARVSPTASTGAVPFPMGATEVTFTVDVRDDVTSEPTETVVLTLLSASGGATLDPSCTVSTLNIEDDD